MQQPVQYGVGGRCHSRSGRQFRPRRCACSSSVRVSARPRRCRTSPLSLKYRSKAKVQDALKLVFGSKASQGPAQTGSSHPLAFLNAGKAQAYCLIRPAADRQIVFHRLAAQSRAPRRGVSAMTGVQHQRDGEIHPGCDRPRAAPRGRCLILPATSSTRLSQQVGQHICSPSAPASFQVCGLPAVVTQIGSSLGHWARLRHHLVHRRRLCEGSRRLSPRHKRRISVDIRAASPVCFRAGCILGTQDKVIGLPAAGKSDDPRGRWSDCQSPPIPRRSGRGGAAARRRRTRRARRCSWSSPATAAPGDRGVGVRSAKGMEVAFWRPDSDRTRFRRRISRLPAAGGTCHGPTPPSLPQ